MNPVFWFLVIVGLIILWFMISYVFPFVGEKVLDQLEETMEILNDTEENKEEEKESEKNE